MPKTKPPARRRYDTDLTDVQWELIAPIIPDARVGGRPRKATSRELIDAILYFLRAGAAWRLLPHDLPPWQTVIVASLRRLRNPVLGILAGTVATVAIPVVFRDDGHRHHARGGQAHHDARGRRDHARRRDRRLRRHACRDDRPSRAAVKAGTFHLVFNIASVAVSVLLIGQLAAFGAATADDPEQRIANAHVHRRVKLVLLTMNGRAALAATDGAEALLNKLVLDRLGRDRITAAIAVLAGAMGTTGKLHGVVTAICTCRPMVNAS